MGHVQQNTNSRLMREGGAKGKTTEGRRGRVDVKESMTYCAAGRLEPASRVGDMLLRATSRSQPALFAPRPLPSPFLCNQPRRTLSSSSAGQRVAGWIFLGRNSNQIQQWRGRHKRHSDQSDTSTTFSSNSRTLFLFVLLSQHHWRPLFASWWYSPRPHKKNNLVVTFHVRSLLGCRWLLCFLGTKSDSPYLS